MRRILSAFLCISMLLCLSACGNEKVLVIERFQKNVTFQMGDITVKGTLDFVSQEDITFTVKEPDYVSGVSFTRDEVSVEDIKTSYGKASDSSPMRLLIDVVANASSVELTVPQKGEFIYSGEVSSAGYKINFDCENEKIISIEAGKYTYIFE